MATAPPREGRLEGRVPPHDLDAEQSVLGAILLDPAAITRVLDILYAEDFYRENNGQIYKAATNLFREGEPIDNVTLGRELEKAGVLERVGGRAGLAMLQESVPTAGNVEYYARIVKSKAYKRRLISAGGKVTSLGYDESLDSDEAVNQAQAEVYAVSDGRTGSGNDLERLYDLLRPAMDRIDAQMASGGGVIGIPSGFHDLDRSTSGFKSGDLIIVAGRPAMGKALALDTPIPTPRGWSTMGALRVGDQVFDELGRPCSVTAATPVQYQRRCFQVAFSDGNCIVADADHRWRVCRRETPEAGRDEAVVLTTVEMAATLLTCDGRPNLSIPLCQPLRFPQAELAVDPYVFGTWLGAGAEVRPGDPEVRAEELAVRAPADAWGAWGRPEPEPVRQGSRSPTGGSRDSQIPRTYLEGSVQQRRALLQGLMDTGGTLGERGQREFATTSARLAAGVLELATGLGLDAARTTGRAAPNSPPWHRARLRVDRRERQVTKITPVDSVPVRCIEVDSPARLYLAGRGCIPTHNTSFVLNVALHAAVENKKSVAVFSLEMSKDQLVERMLCEQARIDAQRLHRGMLSEAEHERLVYALGPLGDAPIFIDDSPMLDDLTLRLKARQAKTREGIDMLIIDYLQLMSGRSRGDDTNRVQEVSAISRGLKAIARELKIPVIAISQLSRGPEARPDKRPMLSDLRESGCLAADTPVFLPDEGWAAPIGDLVGKSGYNVLALDPSTLRLERRLVTRAFSTGRKPVYRLGTRRGRVIRATGNHKFLVPGGWRRLDQLALGQPLAILLAQFGVRELGIGTGGDVRWDEVLSLTPDGEDEVYDLTVDGLHNFVAGDVIVHNSIEQDADIVMFLYRDDYYNREKSEKPGIAEVIVAKHRNGPTGTIELMFRRELTRFENLEKRRPADAEV